MNTKMVVNQTATSSVTRTVSEDKEYPRRLLIAKSESNESQAQNNLENDSIYDNINKTSLIPTILSQELPNSLSRSELSSRESVHSRNGGGHVIGVIAPPIALKPGAITNLSNKTR